MYDEKMDEVLQDKLFKVRKKYFEDTKETDRNRLVRRQKKTITNKMKQKTNILHKTLQ